MHKTRCNVCLVALIAWQIIVLDFLHLCTSSSWELKIKTSGCVLSYNSYIPQLRLDADPLSSYLMLSILTLWHDHRVIERGEDQVDFNVCLRSGHCRWWERGITILGIPAGWIIHFMRFDARLPPLSYLLSGSWLLATYTLQTLLDPQSKCMTGSAFSIKTRMHAGLPRQNHSHQCEWDGLIFATEF